MTARSLALALLGVTGCVQSQVAPKPQLEVVAALELRIDAPGMSPEAVEQSIVAPIELALVGNSDIRALVSEAREGQARLHLSLSNRAELVAVDVLQRVSAIEPQLPEDAEPPVLRPRDSSATTLHFALADQHDEAAQALLRALEATPGVREVSRCEPNRVVTIELDPEAMRSRGVALEHVERAARSALLMQELTVERLLELSLARADGMTITLADLATVRVELAAGECEAYTREGRTSGISVTVAHAEARANVLAQLDAAGERGVIAQRFESRLHVWLTPAAAREQVLEQVRATAGAQWMLELGVEAEPCVGPGTLARLHMSDETINSLVDSLAATPGVALVEHPDNPRARRWLLGPDLEVLARLGGEAASAGSVALLDGEPTSEQLFELDREQLAAHGLDASAVALTMAAALDGLEIGRIRDAGPVILRLGGLADEELGELPLAIADGQTIPLSSVAQLRQEAARARICRRNGERGVVLLVRPQDLERPFDIELPTDYRWGDR